VVDGDYSGLSLSSVVPIAGIALCLLNLGVVIYLWMCISENVGKIDAWPPDAGSDRKPFLSSCSSLFKKSSLFQILILLQQALPLDEADLFWGFVLKFSGLLR